MVRPRFVARGLIYGIIGILAIKLAVGAGGTTTNQQGALKTIAQQPFGKVLLILVAIGLGGYALWRLTHALLGHGPENSDSRKQPTRPKTIIRARWPKLPIHSIHSRTGGRICSVLESFRKSLLRAR